MASRGKRSNHTAFGQDKQERVCDLDSDYEGIEITIQKIAQDLSSLESRVVEVNLHQIQNDLRLRLMKITAKVWFAHSYSLSRERGGGYSSGTEREIKRSDLLNQLNNAFSRFNLPHVSRKDAFWHTWFLGDVVGLSQDQKSTGKSIYLCDRRSVDNFIKAAESAIELVKEQQC